MTLVRFISQFCSLNSDLIPIVHLVSKVLNTNVVESHTLIVIERVDCIEKLGR